MGLATTATLGADRWTVGAGLTLTGYAALRTYRPLRCRLGMRADLFRIGVEVLVALAAVLGSGLWGSPYVFSLAASCLVVGFAFGLGWATAAAAGLTAIVAVPYHLWGDEPTAQASILGGCQLLLVGLVAGYAKRVFGEEEKRTTLALTRVTRLAEANDLLYELYRVAQTLPVSLDLDDTVLLTAGRLKELFQPDVVVIFLADDATGLWKPVVAEGTKVKGSLATADLPAPLRRAATMDDAHLEAALPANGGVSFASKCGIYAALRARGQLVGLLAVERRAADALTIRDTKLLEGLAEQAALSLDNARWFTRLRSVGADEERTRIARDLHDRVGQSLAYLAFELDRLTGRTDDQDMRAELTSLRADVRRAISEVRETLYDLRTDVTDEQDISRALDGFLDRVRDRSDLDVVFRHDDQARVPLTQERELWRIAQEAVTNVERHAQATTVSVLWQANAEGALLEVHDDGIGFNPGSAGRLDSYGMLGMRERANAIGATLEVDTAPGRGTTIRCRIHQTDLARPATEALSR